MTDQTSRALPPFPLSDEVLDQVEHALRAVRGDDGEIQGAEYTLDRLLDFLSGVDHSRATLASHPADDGPEVWDYWDARYTEHDLISALLSEVRRLRASTRTEG